MIILLFLKMNNKSLIDNFLNNNFMKYKLLLITLFACGLGWGQVANGTLDFGSPTNGITATTANTGFGGVRVGTTGGGFTIQNPGKSIGSQGELRGIAPTSASINSVGITSNEYGTAASTFTVAFDLHLSGGSSGTWYFFAGNGASFAAAQSTIFSGTQVFTGLRWVFGASDAITTNNRNVSTWNTTGITGVPFTQNIDYRVIIVGNNSSTSVNYGSNVLSSYKYDLWVNGVLVGEDLAKGQISNGTDINAFRFYGESSTSNVAQLAIDNVVWYNSAVDLIPALTSTTYTTDWSNSAPTASIDAIIDGDLDTTTDLTCEDLTINSGKTLTIGAGTTLSVSGNLVNNGSIIFESNNTSTGRFDSYSGNPITGTGSVTMERYIDGKRAFRFLAPGVTTTSTIANNWQQQVFITGSTTVANAGGFDVTETGAPSMFTFEDSGWAAIANTGLTLNAQKGYRILIRGDRTPSILTSPSNGTMNTPVTLTATGTMVTGDVPYTTLPNQDYTLVANPYISPINWATVTKSNISDTYYAWDPNLGTGNQRGRYVSCDVAGNTSIISGTGSPSTDVDQFIQPGQAVFIQKTTSGVNGSVTIKETDKAATFTDVFRTPNNSSNAINGKLGVNLYESLAYSIGEYPIDGAVVVSGTTFNTNSASDDTKKIMSHGEQVAFVRDNIQLGVEKISAPQENDELSIACVNLVPNKNYVWSVVLQDEFSNEDTYLYDAFTQIYHPIQQNSVISFSTNDNVNSTLTNRFKIVFQTSALTTDDFVKNIKLYPNPAKAGASFYVDGITEATVSVYNVVGQNIPVTVMSQGNAVQVTPSASLSKGVYLVSITTQGITKQVKWIVE
jgi:hypothetical protein